MQAGIHTTQTRKALICSILSAVAWGIPALCVAQINTGSNGSDGAFSPTSNVTINMSDHPTGIYQYTSVNIPSGVTVTFTPNANNTPVVWLVQGSCVIYGTINLSGQNGNGTVAGACGPGGFTGGSGGTTPTPGLGPGGGNINASGGSYGTQGASANTGVLQSSTYGNIFILPLIGGSGGGANGGSQSKGDGGGGGGGGAILIAASNQILLDGTISAVGGNGEFGGEYAGSYSLDTGAGSGGAVRLICNNLAGTGQAIASAGSDNGGSGRIRFDCYSSSFGGKTSGVFTQGFQPIIIPAAGQGIQMAIASVGSVPVASSPAGQLATPDVVISGQQANPIPIVVNCTNLPLNTPITVTVQPANGTPVTVQGVNNTGTAASSTATVSVNMPHGGGIIYAQTVTAVLTASNTSLKGGIDQRSYAQTGLTTDGERFTKMEITASLGGKERIVYLTESGKRYPLPIQ